MKKKAIYAGIVGLVVASIAGVSVSSALADPQPNGSIEPYYVVSNDTGLAVAAGSTNAFNATVSGSPVADNSTFDQKFTGPAGSVAVWTFISPRGSETTRTQWNASSVSAFNSGTTVLLPSANLSAQVTNNGAQNPGSANAVKAAGGQYSVGVAFLNSLGVVIEASYTYITVTPVTGAWTFDTPATVTPPPPTTQTFTSNLNATTIAAADGALSLVAPSNLNVAIGNPVLTNGTSGLSVSTGTLGQFSVQDNRYATHTGWTLTTNVANFTGPVAVNKAQLGVKPVLVSAGSQAGGVTLGTEQLAGSAVYPSTFASAVNNPTVGTTNFNADLKFIAPANAPAGTYTSTLTLTVVPN
ncbi:MAG: hypothetical protein LCH43_02255 [Actinobacteria bacterium]|nr:hypothetical protein [Actinomycetota bacterium]